MSSSSITINANKPDLPGKEVVNLDMIGVTFAKVLRAVNSWLHGDLIEFDALVVVCAYKTAHELKRKVVVPEGKELYLVSEETDNSASTDPWLVVDSDPLWALLSWYEGVPEEKRHMLVSHFVSMKQLALRKEVDIMTEYIQFLDNMGLLDLNKYKFPRNMTNASVKAKNQKLIRQKMDTYGLSYKTVRSIGYQFS